MINEQSLFWLCSINLSLYKKYKVKGFYGTIASTGNATFQFYDINGNLLLSKELVETSEQIELPKAVKIVVSGDGKEVNIYPEFEAMALKLSHDSLTLNK